MLTSKEIEVLTLKSKGLTQSEIAEKLNITQPAVSSFYNNCLKKMKDAEEVLKLKKDMGINDE